MARRSKQVEPTTRVDDEAAAVEQAAEQRLADDAPEAVSDATEAVEATQSDQVGMQAISTEFAGQDWALAEEHWPR